MKKIFSFFNKMFKSKKMQYGTNATILTVVFIGILVVINLIVGSLDIKLDLTKEKIFSLDEQTVEMLNNLDEKVNIYPLYQKGNEPLEFKEILDKYSNNSKFINVELIDPVKNPTFAKQFDQEGKGLSQGSIIFANEDNTKYKVVSTYDLVNYNRETGMADSLKAESAFTSAIVYITSDRLPAVYFTQGHDEMDLSSVKQALEKENYTQDNINLLIEDIPEDAELIVVSSPNRDFDTSEIEKLDKYFDNGGNAAFLFDPSKNQMSKLEQYLREWGVELNKDIVVEGKNDRFYQNPTFILPEMQNHEITSKLKSSDLLVLMPQVTSINVLFEEQRGVKITSLLKSSSDSWGKSNFESQTIEQEPEDISGPLDIAVAISRQNYGDVNKETKILVTGNSQFLSDQLLSMQGVANMDFFLNSVNWSQDQEEKISIRPKSLKPEMLTLTYRQTIVNALIVIILVPLIVFILGGTIWLRRRHL